MGGGLTGERQVAQALGTGAQPEEESGSHLHVGPPLAGRKFEVGCCLCWAAGEGRGLCVLIPVIANWL